MLEKGWMSRFICPGQSKNHHGSRNNNKHSVPNNVNHLMSPTHCIIIDTNASGQSRTSNDNDGIYAGRAIMIGNERVGSFVVFTRIVCSVTMSLSDILSSYLTTYTNIINSCLFTQPNVGSGILRKSTSSVNFVARGQC
jgi:hypothetical protein